MLNKKFFWKSPLRIDGDAYVIFATGLTSTLKYSLPNGVVQAGASLASSIYSSAAGNAVQGLFFSGFYRNTAKYQYANDLVSVGTLLSDSSDLGSAAGNAELCHVAYGAYNGVSSSKVSRYTYANDQVTTGTALSVASQVTSSTGNKSFILIRTGINDGNTNRFDYAADTRITGVNLTSIVGTYSSGSHSGDGTIGFMKGGVNNGTTTVNKIQLAANVCSLGTSLLGPSNGGGKGMTGTVNMGIFALNSGEGAQGCLYYYASDIVMMSAATFTGSPGPGVCANPQGVNV